MDTCERVLPRALRHSQEGERAAQRRSSGAADFVIGRNRRVRGSACSCRRVWFCNACHTASAAAHRREKRHRGHVVGAHLLRAQNTSRDDRHAHSRLCAGARLRRGILHVRRRSDSPAGAKASTSCARAPCGSPWAEWR